MQRLQESENYIIPTPQNIIPTVLSAVNPFRTQKAGFGIIIYRFGIRKWGVKNALYSFRA